MGCRRIGEVEHRAHALSVPNFRVLDLLKVPSSRKTSCLVSSSGQLDMRGSFCPKSGPPFFACPKNLPRTDTPRRRKDTPRRC